MNYEIETTTSILADLGERVRRERLNQNLKMTTIAERAGVSTIVLNRLENGKGCTLANLIRVLRALGKLNQLDLFLPDPGISPIQLAKLNGKIREKASEK